MTKAIITQKPITQLSKLLVTWEAHHLKDMNHIFQMTHSIRRSEVWSRRNLLPKLGYVFMPKHFWEIFLTSLNLFKCPYFGKQMCLILPVTVFAVAKLVQRLKTNGFRVSPWVAIWFLGPFQSQNSQNCQICQIRCNNNKYRI